VQFVSHAEEQDMPTHNNKPGHAAEPLTILLVDDDPDCRMLVRDASPTAKSRMPCTNLNGKEAWSSCAASAASATPAPG